MTVEPNNVCPMTRFRKCGHVLEVSLQVDGHVRSCRFSLPRSSSLLISAPGLRKCDCCVYSYWSAPCLSRLDAVLLSCFDAVWSVLRIETGEPFGLMHFCITRTCPRNSLADIVKSGRANILHSGIFTLCHSVCGLLRLWKEPLSAAAYVKDRCFCLK